MQGLPEAPKEEDNFEIVDVPDAAEELLNEGDEPKPKKKATRGKRGGRKQKEKEQQNAEARAKRANSQLAPQSAVISVATSESAQVSKTTSGRVSRIETFLTLVSRATLDS